MARLFYVTYRFQLLSTDSKTVLRCYDDHTVGTFNDSIARVLVCTRKVIRQCSQRSQLSVLEISFLHRASTLFNEEPDVGVSIGSFF